MNGLSQEGNSKPLVQLHPTCLLGHFWKLHKPVRTFLITPLQGFPTLHSICYKPRYCDIMRTSTETAIFGLSNSQKCTYFNVKFQHHFWDNASRPSTLVHPSVSPTLHVPYQSGASSSPSSSPSSCCDPGPIVDISHGVFYSPLLDL